MVLHGFGGRAAYWEYQLEQFRAAHQAWRTGLAGTAEHAPQWMIAYCGVLKAGAVTVLRDALIDKETLLNRIAESGSVMLVTTSNRYDELRDFLQVLHLKKCRMKRVSSICKRTSCCAAT